MKYDPSLPIAVFLGPSIDRATAEAILTANYYPPVRMGDVYRLLATGVRTILIIDGVFHWVTPVWQREIRTALENGIAVVGAASMGALRAVELGRFGMIGRGTVWSWYRDRAIDGDDEVALLHGDETVNYRPMSEPLVNVRYNVRRAVERGLIAEQHGQKLIDKARQRYFAARSYRALLEDAGALGISAQQLSGLARFLAHEAVDVKREDAIEALTYCAGLAASSTAPGPAKVLPFNTETDGGFSSVAALKRGVRSRHGELVAAESLLARIAASEERLLAELRRTVSETFFLSRWAAERGVEASAEWHDAFRRQWIRTHVGGELTAWLADVGLTPAEFDAEMRQRATVEWLRTSDPGSHGLDFDSHRRCVDLLSGRSQEAGDERAAVQRKLTEAVYVASWAREKGIECPGSVTAEFIDACEARWGVVSDPTALTSVGLDESQYRAVLSQRACFHWAVEQGPNYFGYSTFSYAQAVLTELQVTGGISVWVDQDVAS